MSRLSQQDRQDITRILMCKAQEAESRKQREADLQARTHSVGEKAYNIAYSPEQQEMMSKLGERFFKLDNDFGVSLNGNYERVFLAENKFFGYWDVGYLKAVTTIDVETYPELVEEMLAVTAERKTLDKELKVLRDTIERTLYSVTTPKRLIAIWPEIEDVVKQVCPETGAGMSTALTIPTRNLNLMISGEINPLKSTENSNESNI